jgi:hypothetical protein
MMEMRKIAMMRMMKANELIKIYLFLISLMT